MPLNRYFTKFKGCHRMQLRHLLLLTVIASSSTMTLAVNDWYKEQGKNMFGLTAAEQNKAFNSMNFNHFDEIRANGYETIETIEKQKHRPTKDFEVWAKIAVGFTTVTLKAIIPFYFMTITANATAKLSHSNKNDPLWNYFVLFGSLGTLVYAYGIANTNLGSMFPKTVPVPLTEEQNRVNEEINKKVEETKEEYNNILKKTSNVLLDNKDLANQLTESDNKIQQILETLSTKVSN